MRLLSVIVAVTLLAVAGCGSSSSSSSSGGVSTASAGAVTSTAKFALHAGLAFGAFHRYIYRPLKSGALKNPLSHKLVLLKAVAAGAFTVHEVQAATVAARSNPKLAKLAAPLTALGGGIAAVVGSAKSGHPDLNQLESSNAAIDSIKHEASSAGTSIAEQAPSVP